jgi:FAD/FMN-containing dehydrogenase
MPAAYSRRGFIAVIVAAGAGALGIAPPAEILAAPRPTGPRVGGRLVAHGDADYEHWRLGMPWQMRKPDRYPQFIVQARDAADVIESVRFARRNGLKVAIKSGGHHVWANFLRDGGLLLDLSRLRGATVDRDARTAIAEPGIWARNLLAHTIEHGLGFPVAHCATVPLGGFLLGGGFGVNGDQWGTMSCLAVEAADVITADGEPMRVDARSQPDWYFALRGAGNGFPGVVTRFHLKLFDAPAAVYASTYVFAAEQIPDVAALAGELARAGRPHLEILAITAAAGPDGKGRNRVICALRVAAFAPFAQESRSLLAPLATHPLAAASLVRMDAVEESWDSLFLSSIEAGRGFGFGRYAVDNLWTNEPAEVLRILGERLAESPAPYSHAVVQFKAKTTLPVDAALSVSAPTYAGVYSVWHDPAIDIAAVDWLRTTMRPLARYATGHYINEVDAEGSPERIRGSFSPQAWQRLTAFRRRADPDGVFHDYFGYQG